jgi:hypothetical protein
MKNENVWAILILMVAFNVWLHLYNPSALSGGDDSKWAMYGMVYAQNFTFENILYPKQLNRVFFGYSCNEKTTCSVVAFGDASYGRPAAMLVMATAYKLHMLATNEQQKIWRQNETRNQTDNICRTVYIDENSGRLLTRSTAV